MLNVNVVIICLMFVIAGCGRTNRRNINRDFTLDAKTFDAESLKMISERTGIAFPKGSRGLNMFNKGRPNGPSFIRPSFVARIEIPASSSQAFLTEIGQIPTHDMGVIHPLAESVNWWKPSSASIRLERQDGDMKRYIHAVICNENEKWILYLEWTPI